MRHVGDRRGEETEEGILGIATHERDRLIDEQVMGVRVARVRGVGDGNLRVGTVGQFLVGVEGRVVEGHLHAVSPEVSRVVVVGLALACVAEEVIETLPVRVAC